MTHLPGSSPGVPGAGRALFVWGWVWAARGFRRSGSHAVALDPTLSLSKTNRDLTAAGGDLRW